MQSLWKCLSCTEKNTEIEQTSGVIHKEYRPVKNNYQQVKNMKKVVDFLVSLR